MMTVASNNRLIKVGGRETQKANHYVSDWLLYDLVVGAVGFEPTASCSQGRRANQAALRPDSIEKGSIVAIEPE